MAFRDTGERPESRVGAHVYFSAPKDVAKKGGGTVRGTIVDEIWVPDATRNSEDAHLQSEHSWGRYGFSSQLIKWDNGEESIRLGYWRIREGEKHWNFAAQATVTSSPETVRQLLEQTLAMSSWFEKR